MDFVNYQRETEEFKERLRNERKINEILDEMEDLFSYRETITLKIKPISKYVNKI